MTKPAEEGTKKSNVDNTVGHQKDLQVLKILLGYSKKQVHQSSICLSLRFTGPFRLLCRSRKNIDIPTLVHV